MLAHSSLASFLKTRFIMNFRYGWSYEQTENMIPWELEVHLIMLEKAEADRKAAQSR